MIGQRTPASWYAASAAMASSVVPHAVTRLNELVGHQRHRPLDVVGRRRPAGDLLDPLDEVRVGPAVLADVRLLHQVHREERLTGVDRRLRVVVVNAA